MLAEGPTYDINGNFGAVEKKKFSIDFSKAKTKAKSSCFYYNDDTSYFFLNRKKIYEFKDDNGIVKFTTQFFAWSICNGFRAT